MLHCSLLYPLVHRYIFQKNDIIRIITSCFKNKNFKSNIDTRYVSLIIKMTLDNLILTRTRLSLSPPNYRSSLPSPKPFQPLPSSSSSSSSSRQSGGSFLYLLQSHLKVGTRRGWGVTEAWKSVAKSCAAWSPAWSPSSKGLNRSHRSMGSSVDGGPCARMSCRDIFARPASLFNRHSRDLFIIANPLRYTEKERERLIFTGKSPWRVISVTFPATRGVKLA